MFAQIPTGKLIGKQHYRKKPSAAVQGKNHDGHAFVRDALRQGVGVIVEEAHIASLPDQSLLSLAQCSQKGIVVVPDTLKALAELALNALAQYQGEVIAVTGSVGKTTCKSMVREWLAHGTVIFTSLSPLTLLLMLCTLFLHIGINDNCNVCCVDCTHFGSLPPECQ